MAIVNYVRDIGLIRAITNEFIVENGTVKAVNPAHVCMIESVSMLQDGGYSFPRKGLKPNVKDVIDVTDGILTINGFEKINISVDKEKLSNPKVPPEKYLCSMSFAIEASVKDIIDFIKVAKKYTDKVFIESNGPSGMVWKYSYEPSYGNVLTMEKVISSRYLIGMPSISCYPLDYLENIFKAIDKCKIEKVNIRHNTDYPLVVEFDGFRYLLAPRVESD